MITSGSQMCFCSFQQTSFHTDVFASLKDITNKLGTITIQTIRQDAHKKPIESLGVSHLQCKSAQHFMFPNKENTSRIDIRYTSIKWYIVWTYILMSLWGRTIYGTLLRLFPFIHRKLNSRNRLSVNCVSIRLKGKFLHLKGYAPARQNCSLQKRKKGDFEYVHVLHELFYTYIHYLRVSHLS